MNWAKMLVRLSENAHLPFDKLMALSKIEGPFDRPFDKLTVLSEADPSTKLRVDAEQCRSIEGPFDKLMVLSRVEGLRYPHPPPC